MFAEVVALPPNTSESNLLRLGTRFVLSEDEPLRVGSSTISQLQVDVPVGHVLIGLHRGAPHVWFDGLFPCTLSGRRLHLRNTWYPLVDGDHLVVSTGLVLALRENPLVVARDERLELALDQADDEQVLSVYLDFLEERGDPLRRWLTSDRRDVEAERFFVLGPLSGSALNAALQPTFDGRGFLTEVTLSRPALVGKPGLYWHLELLSTLPVARLLKHLTLQFVVGQPAKTIEGPRGATGWPKTPAPLDVMNQALELLSHASFARTLRTLSFGRGVSPCPSPARWTGAFPQLAVETFVMTAPSEK